MAGCKQCRGAGRQRVGLLVRRWVTWWLLLMPAVVVAKPAGDGGPGAHRSTVARHGQARRPTLIITSPSGAFLRSYGNLRREKLIPEAHVILLVHEEERKLLKALPGRAREHDIGSYEVVRLAGLPRAPAHQRFPGLRRSAGDGKATRLLASPTPYLPAAWRRTFAEILQRSDGLFIPGGADIPAGFYGEAQYIDSQMRTPLRSLYELAFLNFLLKGPTPALARKPGYLIIGFCYGLQALNVSLGGTLVQSIPHELYGQHQVEEVLKNDFDRLHRNYFLFINPPLRWVYRGWFHRIRVTRQTPFFLRGRETWVLSNHRQAIKRVAPDLEIVATSMDGKVPELVRHRRFPNVVGLQGHLERPRALHRLDRFPPQTRRFHTHFWARVHRVVSQNARGRLTGARP